MCAEPIRIIREGLIRVLNTYYTVWFGVSASLAFGKPIQSPADFRFQNGGQCFHPPEQMSHVRFQILWPHCMTDFDGTDFRFQISDRLVCTMRWDGKDQISDFRFQILYCAFTVTQMLEQIFEFQFLMRSGKSA